MAHCAVSRTRVVRVKRCYRGRRAAASGDAWLGFRGSANDRPGGYAAVWEGFAVKLTGSPHDAEGRASMAQEQRQAATEAQQDPMSDEQADVLEEAARGVEGWAARLPEGAPWRAAFESIGGELRTCLAGREAVRRARAA